ncbi:MAG: hypothetical protein ABSE16_20300 [Verrucomicrobiota bacterium]|jgi:hypothetical protein
MTKKSGIPPIPTEEIERLLRDSAPSIWRHVAIISLDNNQAFSGVFAKSFGYEGILTAGHSAEQFLAKERLALAVSEISHRLIVDSKDLDHVRIGYDEVEGYSSSQPDLSFVIIKNEELLRLIRSLQLGFYDLDIAGASVREVFLNPEKPLAKFNWSVAGCPRENVDIANQLIDGQSQKIITSPSVLIQGNLAEYELANNFDYLKLCIPSGFEEYPIDYNGMSGGGIWYQMFLTDDEEEFTVKPILAGVARWQSEMTLKKGYKVRCITGHAWVSIYGCVRRILAEKRAAQSCA